jgi:hypothetical protein
MKQEQPQVSSIGLDARGAVVIRLAFADGRIREAETNQVSFARLAAEGIPVVNQFHNSKW